MVNLFVRHTVKDYNVWKRVYDDFGTYRRDHGVTTARVYRDSIDPKSVTVMHEFEDLDSAQAFMASDELRTRMQNAGVNGPPDVWFVEQVENIAY